MTDRIGKMFTRSASKVMETSGEGSKIRPQTQLTQMRVLLEMERGQRIDWAVAELSIRQRTIGRTIQCQGVDK
jgi:hypothetical protein